MAAIRLLVLFALFHPLLLYAFEEFDELYWKKCPRFNCGKLGELSFPYTNTTLRLNCAPFVVNGCDKEVQNIRFTTEGRWFEVESISQANIITMADKELERRLNSNSCESFNNLSIPTLSYTSLQIITKQTNLFKCDPSVKPPLHLDFNYTGCQDFGIYYVRNTTLPSLTPNCSIIQLPTTNKTEVYGDIFGLLTAKFSLGMDPWPACYLCDMKGEKCQRRSNKMTCISSRKGNKKLALKLGLGIGGPAMIFTLSIVVVFIRRYHCRRKQDSSNLISANASSDPSSKSDLEGGTIYFGVPIFSYSELEEATNNFDSEKEIGDGGFGTVYHGKLHDGREVAVKRLYEHNCKRVKQFMNEIEILTRLRHENLVSLYGCTSRSSRELLLVYEYIPNGTVADHLHHDRVRFGPLTWPIRMRIAVETASALSYLHASDIIHRDVKTNNILLDKNFCVKVADFGLCRLFPNDVTHVSTAPQGTPGYLDPEYYQCYQLTAKSDVYSFGVVLIELISSMPAVDITRHRHEINLATFAVNKIQKCAFDELIDPCLGYKSDEEIKRMTISVAELAFLCLQQDKEMRPSMKEVLEELKAIESGEYELKNPKERHGDSHAWENMEALDCDIATLLKNTQSLPSSDSTTNKWITSDSATPNASS